MQNRLAHPHYNGYPLGRSNTYGRSEKAIMHRLNQDFTVSLANYMALELLWKTVTSEKHLFSKDNRPAILSSKQPKQQSG